MLRATRLPAGLAASLAATLLALACAPGAARGPAEEYGFVARLGTDTISVENVTRRGDALTIDGVDRFPRVRRRHTTVTLGPDGGVRALTMDVETPSEPPAERRRRIEMQVVNDTIVMTKRDSTGRTWRLAVKGAPLMAHVPQMYSFYDLYFLAARHAVGAARGDTTVRMRQFYVDREFDRFPVHDAVVKLRADGTAEIRHDWLSGTGVATLDSVGRLRSYDGSGTTYDVRVERTGARADVEAIATRFAAAETGGGGARQLSVRDTVRASLGAASFTIDYGRPLLRGRTLLGALIPYDRVWRTGANAATQFTTSAPITLAGIALPAGGYTLWTVPKRDGTATLIVNGQTGQWGTSYDARRDVGRAGMTADTLDAPAEQFTIAIVETGAGRGELRMDWGTMRWAAPLVVGAPAPR